MREPNRINHIEISEKHRKLRWILVVALLVIGIFGIGVGLMRILNRDTGWQQVEVATDQSNCSSQFVLQYQFSGSGAEATALYKKISAVYTDACIKAYEVFQVDVPSDAYENLYDINHNVNTVLSVDPLLYDAFVKLEDTRYLYLGPIYAHYNSLIFNTSDELVEELDPALSQDAKDYITALAAFAADETAVQLQLLDDYQVKLVVSQEYLAFAQEHEIENFLDLRYMENAFIIDYLAQCLEEKGFTRAVLSSCDGYTRNLESLEYFNFNIFDRVENTIYPAGVMAYQGPIAMVYLKDYQMAQSDAYYRQSGDHLVHTLVDPADGFYRTSANQLVSYQYDGKCVDVLLAMLPGFVSRDFCLPADVESIWCQDGRIFYTDAKITIGNLLNTEDAQYTAELKN